MNRRTYLKTVVIAGICGVAAYQGLSWFNANPKSLMKQLAAKRDVLAEMVEVIIPETDTPGAKSALVHDYVLKVLGSCNSTFIQKKFLYGMESMEAYCLETFDRGFMDLSPKEKQIVMGHISAHQRSSFQLLNKVYNKLVGEPFFSKLKYLTAEGYCMSMAGATKGLAYDYIPGRFEACIPLKPGQRSWATK